jgi:prophage antirepressor-like protein
MELINKIDETISFNEKNIRIVGTPNEPWFSARDICNILEIKDNRSALRIIPDKWKGERLLLTLGGHQNTSIINEAGLYRLIMRSNKPIAQKFQEVVCEEILPSIRKTGEFKLKEMLKRKEKEIEEKEKVIDEKEKVIEIKNKKIKKLKIKDKENIQKTETIEKELNENKANLVETTIKFQTLNKNHNKMLRARKRDLFDRGSVCYIISHKNFNVNGKIYWKIGKATQSKSENTPAFTNRLTGYNTSAPINYTVHYLIYIDDNTLLEKNIKYRFRDQTVESNKEEWIEDCPIENIIFFCRKICDNMKMPYKERIVDESLTSILEKSLFNDEDEKEMEDTQSEEEENDYNDFEIEKSEDETNEKSKDSEDSDDESVKEEKFNELNKYSPLQELQGECRKYKLSEQGTQAELFNRIQHFKETGERIEYKTLNELIEICKNHDLIHTGNKDILEERIRHFQKTGEKVRYFEEEKQEENLVLQSTASEDEKERILKSLPNMKYTEMVSICSIYKLLQIGNIDVLRERIIKYFENGEKEGEKRIDVYQYDNKGKLIKHFNTVMEAKEKLDLSHALKHALDEKYTLNGFIFRSKHVLFTEEDIKEINKVNKITKRKLTKEDYAEINKKFYDGGETRKKLMEEYSISKTQMGRILGKSKK